MRNFNVAANFSSRVFIFSDGIFKCDVEPEFYECIAIDSIAQDRGDITKVECPSPYMYGEFDEVYSFSGEKSRVTTTLTTYMSRVSLDAFFALFDNDCPFDMHIHFGECQNPSDFNKFDKALIFEDVRATSWGTDPLTALTSGDKGIIQQTLDISARVVFELINLQYSEVAVNETVHGTFVDAVVADTRSCGGACELPSNGCQVQFAITDDGYLYFSIDGAYSWTPQLVVDIITNPTSIPIGIMVVGDTLIIAADDDQLYIGNRSDFLSNPITASWDVVDASVDLPGITQMDSAYNLGAIVGASGTVGLVDIYGEITIVEAGSLTIETLNNVDVNGQCIVAVGDAGVVIYSLNAGESWDIAPTLPTASNLTAVLAKTGKSWLVGDEDGALWCTDDWGVTWSRVRYPLWNTTTTPITDIQANSGHVVYMIQNNRLLKSIDGGSSWVVEPSNSKKPFPTITMDSIATCWDDINTITVVGENAGTGAIVQGFPIN